MNDFDLTGGGVGSWLSDIAGKYFDYRTKTAGSPGIRWTPYGGEGYQYGIAPDGSVLTRGTPAPVGIAAGLGSLLPLLLLAGIALLAYRALK